MSHIRGYGSDADKAAVNAKINVLRMSELHEWLMDELCNGGQRKKKGQRAKPVELGLDWGDT
jgi:ABC-type enterochelin transport system ATPase subunit